MLDLSFFVSATALVDSLSTTQQILILILLFSTERPVRTSLGFIAGVTAAYTLCGLVGLAFVGRLNELVRLFLPSFEAVSNPAYYQAQGLLGLGLLVAGPLYGWYQARSKRPPLDNRLVHLVKNMNFAVALGLGAFLSASTFPMALPYVAAIEKIAASGRGAGAQAAFVLLYNVVYAVPLAVPFVLFLVLKEAVLPRLHLHLQKLNQAVMLLMLSGMGLFFLADSTVYLVTGSSWVPRMDTLFQP